MSDEERQSWSLGVLLNGLAVVPPHLSAVVVEGISIDSRTVSAGDMFIAISGTNKDGADYIEQAISKGAVVVLLENGSREYLQGVMVEDLRSVTGRIASRFYGHPSSKLKIAAVTGTDGKSSVTHFIASAMEQIEGGASVIGTLGGQLMADEQGRVATGHTTPPSIELQKLFSRFLASGAKSVALEASSHGIEQSRLSGSVINSAVLTQVGRDHLDYHGSISNYREVKRGLFYMPDLESVVVNLDDELGREIYLDPAREVKCIGYGLESDEIKPDLYGKIIMQGHKGIALKIEYQHESKILNSMLYGKFNASNLLASLGLLISWKISFARAVDLLERVVPVPGRMEPFMGNGPTIIVDYAHTPGALAAALVAIREHLSGASTSGKIWVLFGCGGDRDKGKRQEMGAVAEQYADVVILTDDNPRGESAEEIVQQILLGMEQPDQVKVIHDRAEAIHYSYGEAGRDDIVLIAGKGHEEYQLVGNKKISFSDRTVAVSITVDGELS